MYEIIKTTYLQGRRCHLVQTPILQRPLTPHPCTLVALLPSITQKTNTYKNKKKEKTAR